MVMGNKHDELEPSMSRLVIFNHVKEGMELARQVSSSISRIIDFIPEHHGTSLDALFLSKSPAEGEPGGAGRKRLPLPGPQAAEQGNSHCAFGRFRRGRHPRLDEHTPSALKTWCVK